MGRIYLDHNATAPMLPEVAEAISECCAAGLANPSSQHAQGRRARQKLEDAREEIGRLLGADLHAKRPDRVIFTSGGTEANNLAILGLAGKAPAHAVVSAIEHPSIAAPAEWLERHGWRIDRLPAGAAGTVDPESLDALLRPDTRFVSVMLGNNETGVVQPVRRLAEICAARGLPLHTDAVQAAGKIDVDFRQLGVAALSASAHKFHGPVGVGVLVLGNGVPLEPILWGGVQQSALRPGTEPVALAVGMHVALEAWHRERNQRRLHIEHLRDALEARLTQACPELVINGASAERLPHTSSITFPGVEGQQLMMVLDLDEVACSTGSACASGSSEPSPTLLAMGLSRPLAASSLRFSLGCATTAAEVAEAARRIIRCYKRLRSPRGPRNLAITGRIGGSNLL